MIRLAQDNATLIPLGHLAGKCDIPPPLNSDGVIRVSKSRRRTAAGCSFASCTTAARGWLDRRSRPIRNKLVRLRGDEENPRHFCQPYLRPTAWRWHGKAQFWRSVGQRRSNISHRTSDDGIASRIICPAYPQSESRYFGLYRVRRYGCRQWRVNPNLLVSAGAPHRKSVGSLVPGLTLAVHSHQSGHLKSRQTPLPSWVGVGK